MKPRIAYTKPSITELEVRYATDAAANGWGEQCYAWSSYDVYVCRMIVRRQVWQAKLDVTICEVN